MIVPIPSRAAIGLALGVALLGPPAHAQGGPAALVGESATESGQALEDLEGLEAQIEQARERAAEWSALAAEYEQAGIDAPERLRAIEAELAGLAQPAAGPDPDASTPAELEVALLGAEQDLALAQRELVELQRELDRRSARRRALPELMADAKKRLAEMDAEPPVAGDDPERVALRERLTEQRRLALEAEARSLEQELLSYEARGQLLGKRIERAQLRMARLDERVEALRQTQSEQWKREAERQTEQALRSIEDAETLSPDAQALVRRLAEENAALAQSRSGDGGLLAAIDEVSQKLARAEQRVVSIDADLERLAYKVETAGLIDSVGLLLRNTRQQAPDVGMYRRFIRMRQEEISAVQERQVELRQQLEALADVDGIVALVLERLGAVAPDDRARLESVLRDLLETKRKHLATLEADYELYFQKLVDFDARQQELIDKTERLLLFIDQQILWIPSGGALRPRILTDTIDALGWLATPRYWAKLATALLSDLRQAPLSNLGALALFALALGFTRRIPPRLAALARQARPSSCIDAKPTLEAVGLSALLAAWAPLVLVWVGWRLGQSPEANEFVRSFAHGALSAGVVWVSLELPRQLLRRDGVADAHFGWPAAPAAALRRHIGAIAAFSVPLVFGIQMLEIRGDEAARESLGRIAFIALMLALVALTHRILRAAGPLRPILAARRELRMERWTWRLVHAVCLAVPIGLAAGAARGYFFTALELGKSYHVTLVFLFALWVLFELALRWTLLARRRLAFEKLEDARAAAAAARAQEDSSSEAPPVSEPELDLAVVDAQTGRLLTTSAVVVAVLGLWVVWSDLVPALGILDRVELWTTSETVSVETTSADGTRVFQSEERVRPVTLAAALRALILLFMTVVLVRNLPGVLEISLFRRLGTATGERYAYATIAKYAVALLGGVLATRALGIGWNNVQWLVAAVGLGLGFGLQEIFANFVSGLIILFERPIRVGDTVTIGDVSGTVSRIRIRATWITGFDRKELVVPNKEFVTSQLVNWSLSDQILRVDVPVGIAYGSDTELAMRELLAAAEENPSALRDPKPQVLFRGFGASSLDFELRVFSPDVDRRLMIHHQLLLAVDQRFRAAGIEIAFPQRDLHVRTLPKEWLRRGGEGGEGDEGGEA